MHLLNKYFILFIFLLPACLPRPKPLWIEPVCYSTSQEIATMKTLFIKGKMKVGSFGCGLSGDLYLIATTPGPPATARHERAGKLRADVINPFGPLFSLTITEGRFALVIYPKGEVYLGNTEKFSTHLPRLSIGGQVNLRGLIYLLGQQMWPVHTEHIVYASNKKDAYYIRSFNYPTLEELWLRKDNLRIKKIKIKNQAKKKVFEAHFFYKNGKVELLKIHIGRIKIELTYLTINQNIEIKDSSFKLKYPEGVKKRYID